MTSINGKACVANGRNLYLNYKAIKDTYYRNGLAVNITLEPFDSATNMWHIVVPQGSGIAGIYLLGYANGKIPDSSDWSYSADVKGTGNPYMFGIEKGNHDPVIGTVSSEWSRISQSGHVGINNKTIVMYFDSNSSPVDVYIKMPKLEIGKVATPLTPAPVDKVFSDGRQVYGRNLLKGTSNADTTQSQTGWGNTGGSINWIWTGKDVLDMIGKTYTYSVFLTATDCDLSILVALRYQNKTIEYKGNTIKAGTSGYSTLTFTVPNTSLDSIMFLPKRFDARQTDTHDITWRQEKLEQGTTASLWTPAPEDVM